jgi:hypothetical protein
MGTILRCAEMDAIAYAIQRRLSTFGTSTGHGDKDGHSQRRDLGLYPESIDSGTSALDGQEGPGPMG